MKKLIRVPNNKIITSGYWPVHAHSSHSVLDGMPSVQRMIDKVVSLKQPALALTDHGNGGGWVPLYQGCKKAGILPFPGVEGYLLDPTADINTDKNPTRYHVGLMALDERGWEALSALISLTHTRPRFSRFARMFAEDLATLGRDHGDHIALTTGCFFGLVQQSLVNDSPGQALRAVQMYASWFPNTTYVEIQNHNIVQDTPSGKAHEQAIVKQLVAIADRLGLPVVIGQDSHYVDQKEKHAHAMMKKMVYGSVEDAFPGDSFHLASSEWVQEHFTQPQWERALEGHSALLDMHALSIPPLDKYSTHVPPLVKDPWIELRRKAVAGLKKLGKWSQPYKDLLDYELGVIKKVGFADYFHVVKWVVNYCERNNIAVEARGSAIGSLVCYAIGISQVDPVERKLLFDRFLAEDRTSPPDIDLDIEDQRLDEVRRACAAQFDSIRIGTWAALGLREEDGQGNVVISYKAYLARRIEKKLRDEGLKGAALEAKLKPAKSKIYAQVQSIDDVSRLYGPQEAGDLQAISDMGTVKKSYGVHASGVLLSSADLPWRKYIPQMLVASSDTAVSQFAQDDVEKFGLLKLDLLGQATLTVMRLCQEMIGRTNPTDFTWIPEDDPEACKILRSGQQDNGIFHFEGYTKAKGGKEMGIKSTDDAILASALFMPGAATVHPDLGYSQTELYLKRRKMTMAQRKADITYMHPAFERALSNTYGAVIYQEQVINIVRGLGLDVVSTNKFFKVVKDSGKGSADRNRERIAEVRKEFDAACVREGLDPDRVWEATASFVAYGFNSSHAAGYGLRSYRCAYLKAHYPLEFMTALLQAWSGRDKEKIYARECRRIGIRILPPDVNISGAIWSIDRKHSAVRKGLQTVALVGLAASRVIEENAPYSDISDLVTRTASRAVTGGGKYEPGKASTTLSGTCAALYAAGALDQLEDE